MVANLDWIRAAFRDRTYFYTSTGLMKVQKRGLSLGDLEEAIGADAPEIVEDYPDDPRGACCLVLGWADLARPLHVVVGYGISEDVVIDIITAYEPEVPEWYNPRARGAS